MYALQVKNLSFNYGKKIILKDISLNIEKGKFVSIIGPNGSGKSTLLKNLNHIHKPKSGKIQLEELDIKKIKPRELAMKIALVPQNTIIDYEFTVEDIVLMGRHPYKGRFQKEDENDYIIVNQAMEMTNTLHLKDRIITEISGGERQRVIIAKALAQNPAIILLDEPTSHLDINHQIEILNLLRKLNQDKGTTIIVVIHDINLAARYSDKIVILNEGKIVDVGSPDDVITKKNIESIYNIDVVIEKNKYSNSLYLTPIN